MKKVVLIGTGILLAVTLFGIVGFAYAQSIYPESLLPQMPAQLQPSDSPEFPYGCAGWGRATKNGMNGRRLNSALGGMMDFELPEEERNPLRDYLWPAVVEAFGLSDEQIEAFELVREVSQDVKESFTQEDFRNMMRQAKITAIKNALVDGAISEQQADYWLERLELLENAPGKSGNIRQGFSRGVIFGRQMMICREYLDAAIAEALDISLDELEKLCSERDFSLQVYAKNSLDLSDEEVRALQIEIFTIAVDAALEDAAITQVQADWLMAHLGNLESGSGWFGRP